MAELLDVLHTAADAVRDAIGVLDDWSHLGLAAAHPGQYRSDVAADAAVLRVLLSAGLSVMSEESGTTGSGEVVVVVDPIDGSTNASRGIPWFATSLCAVDADGPVAAVVANQATGVRHWAERGGGAFRDGVPIRPSGCTSLGEAVVGLSGMPSRRLGWRQFRALGASALDLCAVADGTLDAFLDCTRRGEGAHGPWDYLGAWLVLAEAGAAAGDAQGRDLLVWGHDDRRSPAAGATPELLDDLLAAFASS